MTDDDALFARVDEALRLNLTAIRQREEAPYDGIMGKLPDWIPDNFHRELSAIRDKLLATYQHRDLLDYISEMRGMGMQGSRDAGEFVDLVELKAKLDKSESLPVTPGGMLTGEMQSDTPYSRPRTPFNIMQDVSVLAQIHEAVNLGPEAGLALLTDSEHAKQVAKGMGYSEHQSKIASNPRGKVGVDGETINETIGRLALAPEYEEEGAKDLWRRFFDVLDELGLNRKEVDHPTDFKKSRYEYDFKGKRKPITFGSFEKTVSDYRTGKKKLT